MYIFKILIYTGLGLIAVGFIALGLAKMGLNVGKLPGDLYIKKEKYGIYFPIITSLVLSAVITIILNLVFWLFRK